VSKRQKATTIEFLGERKDAAVSLRGCGGGVWGGGLGHTRICTDLAGRRRRRPPPPPTWTIVMLVFLSCLIAVLLVALPTLPPFLPRSPRSRGGHRMG